MIFVKIFIKFFMFLKYLHYVTLYCIVYNYSSHVLSCLADQAATCNLSHTSGNLR